MKKFAIFTSIAVVLLILVAGTAVVARGGVCHRSGASSGMTHGMHGNHHRGSGMMGWMHNMHSNLSGWWSGSDASRGHDMSHNNDMEDVETKSAVDPGDTTSDTVITLRTTSTNGMAFQGASEPVTEQMNPTIKVKQGETVAITLINTSGVHDLAIPGLNVKSAKLSDRGARTTVQFTPETTGEYTYYCTLPGHRAAGMEGPLIVE